MTAAFGAHDVAVVRGAPRTADADVALVAAKLAALRVGGRAELNLTQPLSTAAFSRRDSLLPGYASAQDAVLARGFSPVIRPVGGHLAVYDAGALVLHLWAPHPEARVQIRHRFELFGAAVVQGLRRLGVDARLGPVPGEYCDGEFSVNDSGRAKLVGTGQRITRAGFLFSAVVMVQDAGPAREALTAAYASLGLTFDPRTVGCVADRVPGVTSEEVCEELIAALGGVVPLMPAAGETLPRPTYGVQPTSQVRRRSGTWPLASTSMRT